MRAREFITENRNRYLEIEFVCANKDVSGSTSPKDQDALFQALKQVPNIIVYRQDFDESEEHISGGKSMAVIVVKGGSATATKVRELAAQHGVMIDLTTYRDDRFIDRLYNDRVPAVTSWYDNSSPAVTEDENTEPVRLKIGGTDPKVKSWIQKVYDMFPQQFGNNHVIPLDGEGDDQEFALFELVPSFKKRGAVEVKWIQAYPLRQGVGSKAMKILQDLAQQDGITLTLYPWDKGQVSQSKLMKFYKKQGFVPTSKGSKNMVWEPSTDK